MDESQRSRTGGSQQRGLPWGLMVLFVVAVGSGVFFVKSASYLRAEFQLEADGGADEIIYQGQEPTESFVSVDDTVKAPPSGGDSAKQEEPTVIATDGDDDDDGSSSKQKPTTVGGLIKDKAKADDRSKTTTSKQKPTTVRTAEKPSEEEGPKQDKAAKKGQEDAKTTPQNRKKPLNVVILYPDDWRHDDIGGVAPVVRTPFLNRLASEGIRFTHNCVTTSICWISRATLFTGQFVSRHGSTHLKFPRFVNFTKWQHTWPYLLQKQGDYHVGHIGKWQFHDVQKNLMSLFNFSFFIEGRHWHRIEGKHDTAAVIARNAALNFLRTRPPDKPFAVTVAFYPPKAVGIGKEPGVQWKPDPAVRATYENITIPEPYEHLNMSMTAAYNLIHPKIRPRVRMARGRWRERWNSSEHYQVGMKNYYALITQVDKACEEIVDELKAQGLYDNTMVIFTTDNGLYHGAHGLAGKWYPYDESIRVPLIVYDPRMPQDKRGTLDDSFTLNIDLAETILDAAGIEPDPVMQGRNIADLYLPKETLTPEHRAPWRDEFFYEFPDGTGGGGGKNTALIRKDFKYIYWQEDLQMEQLYDMKQDPHEFYDVKDLPQHQSRLKEMRQRHDELKEQVFAPCTRKTECDPFYFGRRRRQRRLVR